MTTHYLFEDDEDFSEYLLEAKKSIKDYQNLVKATQIDVLNQLKTIFLKNNFIFEAAQENDQNYSQVMIRSLKEGALLHADFANFLKPNWQIKNIDAEFAWNIFLETPEQGGECVVFNKQWDLSDNQFILDDTYGYSDDVVKGKDSMIHQPQEGDLVIFNSKNFHKVNQSFGKKDRVTIGGHLGRDRHNSLKILSWV